MIEHNQERGFTALSMVLGIALVVSVISLYSFSKIIKDNAYKSRYSKKIIKEIEQNLVSYIRVNNNLPCPATISSNGVGVCSSGNYIGLVPWRDIGLSKKNVVDSWGRYITYVANLNHTTTSFSSNDICVLSSLSDDKTTAPKAAFILISHGINGRGAISYNFNASSLLERKNTFLDGANSALFYNQEECYISKEHTDDFDDYLSYVALDSMF
jgi:hypothetical protein